MQHVEAVNCAGLSQRCKDLRLKYFCFISLGHGRAPPHRRSPSNRSRLQAELAENALPSMAAVTCLELSKQVVQVVDNSPAAARP